MRINGIQSCKVTSVILVGLQVSYSIRPGIFDVSGNQNMSFKLKSVYKVHLGVFSMLSSTGSELQSSSCVCMLLPDVLKLLGTLEPFLPLVLGLCFVFCLCPDVQKTNERQSLAHIAKFPALQCLVLSFLEGCCCFPLYEIIMNAFSFPQQ